MEEPPTYKTDANQAEGKGPRSDLPKWLAQQTPCPDLPSEKNGWKPHKMPKAGAWVARWIKCQKQVTKWRPCFHPIMRLKHSSGIVWGVLTWRNYCSTASSLQMVPWGFCCCCCFKDSLSFSTFGDISVKCYDVCWPFVSKWGVAEMKVGWGTLGLSDGYMALPYIQTSKLAGSASLTPFLLSSLSIIIMMMMMTIIIVIIIKHV